MTDSQGHLAAEQRRVARIKFEILAEGLRLTVRAQEALFGASRGERAKAPVRTRSGVSGGLDIRLADRVFVNAPVMEPFAKDARIVMDWSETAFQLLREGEFLTVVEPLPEPQFSARRTRDDSEAMVRIAQMCSPDRLCYGMTGPSCSFWPLNERCKFCSIGLNYPADAGRKRDQHFFETLEAALHEPVWPARHVLLGGGTPRGRDMGALMAARLCEGIKRIADISVYVMIVAPLDDHYIDALYDAGVDELGLNLEFWSDPAWDAYIPGKRDRVGRHRYLEALEYSVKRFGSVRTRSILIAGLEPATHTLNGVRALSDIGVMPIVSPFRPLAGTALQEARGFSAAEYFELYDNCRSLTDAAGLPLGPTCICCQNNTLALPFGDAYHWYGTHA